MADPNPRNSEHPASDPLGSAGPADVLAPGPGDPDGLRQLVLVKDGQRYLFRYTSGEETKVLQTLIDMVHDPDSDLDWFDAAVLSHQMGQRLSDQLGQLLKP